MKNNRVYLPSRDTWIGGKEVYKDKDMVILWVKNPHGNHNLISAEFKSGYGLTAKFIGTKNVLNAIINNSAALEAVRKSHPELFRSYDLP